VLLKAMSALELPVAQWPEHIFCVMSWTLPKRTPNVRPLLTAVPGTTHRKTANDALLYVINTE
jgi:hypothetical protein